MPPVEPRRGRGRPKGKLSTPPGRESLVVLHVERAIALVVASQADVPMRTRMEEAGLQLRSCYSIAARTLLLQNRVHLSEDTIERVYKKACRKYNFGRTGKQVRTGMEQVRRLCLMMKGVLPSGSGYFAHDLDEEERRHVVYQPRSYGRE